MEVGVIPRRERDKEQDNEGKINESKSQNEATVPKRQQRPERGLDTRDGSNEHVDATRWNTCITRPGRMNTKSNG